MPYSRHLRLPQQDDLRPLSWCRVEFQLYWTARDLRDLGGGDWCCSQQLCLAGSPSMSTAFRPVFESRPLPTSITVISMQRAACQTSRHDHRTEASFGEVSAHRWSSNSVSKVKTIRLYALMAWSLWFVVVSP